MVDFWEQFRSRLVSARERAKMTQRTASARVGISQSYLSDLERGVKQAHGFETIAQIMQTYGGSLDHLAGISDNPIPNKGTAPDEYETKILAMLNQLSEDGKEELLLAMTRIHEVDQQRQANIKEHDLIQSALEEVLTDEEGEMLAEAIALGRSGDDAAAWRIIDDLRTRLQARRGT